MDQLKQYLEIAKKQHFWILCGLAVLVPLIVFWVASGHLAKVYADQKTKINGAVTGMQPLLSGDHANPEWVKHVNDETEKLRTDVLHAWERLYKQQKDVLKWPQGLQPDFIAAFSKPESSDDPRAMEPLCERYQNYVKTELSHMAEIVQAEWAPGAAGGGREAARPRLDRQIGPDGREILNPDEAKKTYIVYWDPADEGHLVDDYDWVDPPSPLDVRYAQEELWVLEQICNAIERTNVGATGDFDAVVREIHRSLIGYDATDKNPLGEGSNRIDRPHSSHHASMMPVPAGPPGMVPGMPGGRLGPAFEAKRPMRHRTTDEGALGMGARPHAFVPPGAPGMGMMPGQIGQAGPVDPEAWLKDGRYVDGNGKPLLGSEWATSTSPEYNRMAFKITLVADQQRWQKLLVELCNSPLPLQVREVRLNPDDHEGRGPAIEGMRPNRQPGQTDTLHNVTLEIEGVAYLMNPPNLAKLGITAAAVSAAAPGPLSAKPATAPAATPAAAPAAPAPAAPAAAPVAAPAATQPGKQAPATALPAVAPPAKGAVATPAAPPTPVPTTTAPAAKGPATPAAQ